MKPLVSVLMSVHNEPLKFIDVAVLSICHQTYTNIELVIIDDCSNDATFSHLSKLAETYKCLRLFRNTENIGLTATLNKGLTLVKGDYIARMDADDYSSPDRLIKQVKYLEQHPDIDIVGTGVISFGEKNSFMSPINGFTVKEVQSNLFFTSSLCHPSVMIRSSFLKRFDLRYDESVKKGQDYDLWERASEYGKLSVMKDILLYYRIHPKQITSTNRKDQNHSAEKIMRRRLNRLGINPTDVEMRAHMSLKKLAVGANLDEIKLWISKLISYSQNANFVDSKNLSDNLYEKLALMKLKARKLPEPREIFFLLDAFCARLKMFFLIKYYSKRIDRAVQS